MSQLLAQTLHWLRRYLVLAGGAHRRLRQSEITGEPLEKIGSNLAANGDLEFLTQSDWRIGPAATPGTRDGITALAFEMCPSSVTVGVLYICLKEYLEVMP